MRIAIMGNSGSGKTTLARQLGERHGLDLLDLDTLAWEPGQVAVARDPALARSGVRAFCESRPGWVVEGCYGDLIGASLAKAGLLVFLDPGLETCLANCRARPWEPHKYPSKQAQDEKLEFLLAWVEEYYVRDGDLSLQAHAALFEAARCRKARIDGRADAARIAQLASA